MILNLIALLFPALAFASIDVELTGVFEQDVQVKLSGYDVDVISDTEIDSFQLSDSNLNPGVEAYFGAEPTDVAFKDPTPWGDLYTNLGWKQVTRTLVPTTGRVLSMTSEKETLLHQVLDNKGQVTATYSLDASHVVQNNMKSSWSSTEQLTIGDEFNIGVAVQTANDNIAMDFESTMPWGVDDEKLQMTSVGTTSLEITVKPQQIVAAELIVTKGTLIVEVEYEASLSGDFCAYYEEPYKGHNYWAVGVSPIMSKAGLGNSLKSTQTIELNFYTDANVIVYEKKTGDVVLDVVL